MRRFGDVRLPGECRSATGLIVRCLAARRSALSLCLLCFALASGCLFDGPRSTYRLTIEPLPAAMPSSHLDRQRMSLSIDSVVLIFVNDDPICFQPPYASSTAVALGKWLRAGRNTVRLQGRFTDPSELKIGKFKREEFSGFVVRQSLPVHTNAVATASFKVKRRQGRPLGFLRSVPAVHDTIAAEIARRVAVLHELLQAGRTEEAMQLLSEGAETRCSDDLEVELEAMRAALQSSGRRWTSFNRDGLGYVFGRKLVLVYSGFSSQCPLGSGYLFESVDGKLRIPPLTFGLLGDGRWVVVW